MFYVVDGTGSHYFHCDAGAGLGEGVMVILHIEAEGTRLSGAWLNMKYSTFYEKPMSNK